MNEKINMIITMLEAEKTLLIAKKEKNNAEIWKCDLLIQYYMEIRLNLLTNLNERKESLNEYNYILELFDKIPTSILEKFKSFVTENKFIEKAIDTEEEVKEIEENENEIKKSILKTKKKKKKLLEKNKSIENKIRFIDEQLNKPIESLDEGSIRKKLLHKHSKNKK